MEVFAAKDQEQLESDLSTIRRYQDGHFAMIRDDFLALQNRAKELKRLQRIAAGPRNLVHINLKKDNINGEPAKSNMYNMAKGLGISVGELGRRMIVKCLNEAADTHTTGYM